MPSNHTLLLDLIVITERLTDLMVRENEILRGMRPSDICELQKDKAVLAQSYERRMRLVREDPTILSEASLAVREKLIETGARFETVLNENEQTLRAVKSVSERVMKIIVSTANEQRAAPAYSSAGLMNAGPTSSGRRSVAVTLNKQF